MDKNIRLQCFAGDNGRMFVAQANGDVLLLENRDYRGMIPGDGQSPFTCLLTLTKVHFLLGRTSFRIDRDFSRGMIPGDGQSPFTCLLTLTVVCFRLGRGSLPVWPEFLSI